MITPEKDVPAHYESLELLKFYSATTNGKNHTYILAYKDMNRILIVYLDKNYKTKDIIVNEKNNTVYLNPKLYRDTSPIDFMANADCLRIKPKTF